MELEIVGHEITKENIEFSTSLYTDADYEIDIAGEFSMRIGGEQINFDLTEHGLEPAELPSLLHRKIASAIAEESGALALDFEDGTRLRVEPSPRYEAWTMTGPHGRMIVCMPGGELAIWSQEPSNPGTAQDGFEK